MDVLFVCSGNTCRSPMAEAIAQHLAEARGLSRTIGSRGLRAQTRMTTQALHALRRRGIPARERPAVQLTDDAVQDAALVLCMTERQRSILAEAMPNYAMRIHTWATFIALHASPNALPAFVEPNQAGQDATGYDLPDPHGQDDSVYEATARTIEVLVAVTLDLLIQESRSAPRRAAGSVRGLRQRAQRGAQ